MNTHPGGNPCPACGAHVGHRYIELPESPTASFPSRCWMACPRSQLSLPEDVEALRSELSTVRRHLDLTREVMIDALHERDQANSNLTSVQARCTELLEEVRALKVKIALERILDDHTPILAALAKS